MSIKQFPVNFKGYDSGDAGLTYPHSSVMLNCRVNHSNAIEQMNGFSLYKSLSTTGIITSLYEYNFVYLSGTPGVLGRHLIAAYYPLFAGADTVVYRIDSSGTASNITPSAVDFDTNPIRFTTFLNNLIYSGDYSSGVLFALSADAVTPKSLSTAGSTNFYMTPHYSRLFVSDNRYTLKWSDVDTIDTWPAANTLNIQQEDGDAIVGLEPYKGDLYVFKNSFVYKIIGNNFNATSGNFSLIKMEGIPGAINQKAICVANGNMYWVSQKYIVEFNGSSFKYVDYPYLADDRAGLAHTITTKEPYILQHNEEEHEIIFMRRGTDTWWGYDYLNESWSKHSISTTTMKIESMTQYRNSTTTVKSLLIGTDAAKVEIFGDYDQFLNSVSTAIAIPSYYETDWMDMGTWQRKCATRVIVDTKQDGFLSAHPYTLSCSTYYDYDTVVVDTQVFACDGASNQFHDIYPEVQTFRRIKLRFANSVLDTKMQVNRAVIEYDLVDESGRI